jgi:hypothetical protein
MDKMVDDLPPIIQHSFLVTSKRLATSLHPPVHAVLFLLDCFVFNM